MIGSSEVIELLSHCLSIEIAPFLSHGNGSVSGIKDPKTN